MKTLFNFSVIALVVCVSMFVSGCGGGKMGVVGDSTYFDTPHPQNEAAPLDVKAQRDILESRRGATARLEVNSTPQGATILINGADQGRTTPATLNIPPGRITVTLRRSGYRDYAKRIRAKAGRIYTVSASLRPSPPTSHPFAGDYTGTYSGSDSGTWTAVVDTNGTMNVTVSSPSVGVFPGHGTVSPSGDVTFVTRGTGVVGDITITWEGRFHQRSGAVTGSGTWVASSGDSGSWTGGRS